MTCLQVCIGAALLVPQSLAIIAACYPQDERGRAIGLWAGASALTTAMGPAVGGVLMDLCHFQPGVISEPFSRR